MIDMSGSLLPLRFHPCGPRMTDLSGISSGQSFLHPVGTHVNSRTDFSGGLYVNFHNRYDKCYILCFFMVLFFF